jgi:predicted methyltransferase
MATYTLRIDDRGREVLLQALKLVKNAAEEPIVNGEFDAETLQQHEELLQLHRGVLYVRPDPEPEVEEPVVGPEAGINQQATVDEQPN